MGLRFKALAWPESEMDAPLCSGTTRPGTCCAGLLLVFEHLRKTLGFAELALFLNEET